MKLSIKYIISICILLTFWNVSSQTKYKVKYVTDTVYANGIMLKKGQSFLNTDTLFFKHDTASVLVTYKRGTKRRLLLGNVFKEKKITSLKQYESYFDNQITRSEQKITLEKLQHQKINNMLGVVDTLTIVFREDSYVLNNKNYFFLQYFHEGEQVNIKLLANNGKISIPENILKEQKTIARIYHYSEKYFKSEQLTPNLELYKVNKPMIQTLVASLRKVNTKLSSKARYRILYEYLFIMYPDLVFNIKDLLHE